MSKRVTYHDVVECKPALGRYSCGDQGRDCSTEGIRSLKDARHNVCVGHITDPSTPCCINEAIAETDKNKHHDQNGVWRMDRNDDVWDEVAERADDGDASLAEFDMDVVIEDGGEGVADEGGEKDEGDDCVVEVVVSFELRRLGGCGVG